MITRLGNQKELINFLIGSSKQCCFQRIYYNYLIVLEYPTCTAKLFKKLKNTQEVIKNFVTYVGAIVVGLAGGAIHSKTLVGWLVGWLAGWMVGWLVSRE